MPNRIQTYRPPGHPAPRQVAREYDRARQADKNFYSSARWVKVRAYKLACNPLCEECQRQGRVTAAVHVHHKKPRKTHHDLAFDMDNLESLCVPCHNAKPER